MAKSALDVESRTVVIDHRPDEIGIVDELA